MSRSAPLDLGTNELPELKNDLYPHPDMTGITNVHFEVSRFEPLAFSPSSLIETHQYNWSAPSTTGMEQYKSLTAPMSSSGGLRFNTKSFVGASLSRLRESIIKVLDIVKYEGIYKGGKNC